MPGPGGHDQVAGRAPLPPELRREVRMQITITTRDAADLDRIGKAWDVPGSTALYFIAAGRLAELRGEALKSAGGDLLGKIGEWLNSIHEQTEVDYPEHGEPKSEA